jgi:hypothetical protein
MPIDHGDHGGARASREQSFDMRARVVLETTFASALG